MEKLCEKLTGSPDCDLCQEMGWYGDGGCDTFCDSHDPDCPLENLYPECWNDNFAGYGEAKALFYAWAATDPDPGPGNYSGWGPPPFPNSKIFWSFRDVSFVTDDVIAVAVEGKVWGAFEDWFIEKTVYFDRSSGSVIRMVRGKFDLNYDAEHMLVNLSRAEWRQQGSGHDPFFYTGENVYMITHDGKGDCCAVGGFIRFAGSFRREAGIIGAPIVWKGQRYGEPENRVTFRLANQPPPTSDDSLSLYDARDCCGDGMLCDALYPR